MTLKLNSIPKTWRRTSDRMHSMATNHNMDRFKSPRLQGWHFSSQETDPKRSVSGVRTKKTSWLISTYFQPNIPKKMNSHVTIRSVVRDLTYPFFGCKSPYRPWASKNLEGPAENLDFRKKKKVGVFDIVNPLWWCQ